MTSRALRVSLLLFSLLLAVPPTDGLLFKSLGVGGGVATSAGTAALAQVQGPGAIAANGAASSGGLVNGGSLFSAPATSSNQDSTASSPAAEPGPTQPAPTPATDPTPTDEGEDIGDVPGRSSPRSRRKDSPTLDPRQGPPRPEPGTTDLPSPTTTPDMADDTDESEAPPPRVAPTTTPSQAKPAASLLSGLDLSKFMRAVQGVPDYRAATIGTQQPQTTTAATSAPPRTYYGSNTGTAPSSKVCWTISKRCCYEEVHVGYKCKDYYAHKYARCHPVFEYQEKCGPIQEVPSEHPRPPGRVDVHKTVIKHYDTNYGPHVAGYPSGGESGYYVGSDLPKQPYGVSSKPYPAPSPAPKKYYAPAGQSYGSSHQPYQTSPPPKNNPNGSYPAAQPTNNAYPTGQTIAHPVPTPPNPDNTAAPGNSGGHDDETAPDDYDAAPTETPVKGYDSEYDSTGTRYAPQRTESPQGTGYAPHGHGSTPPETGSAPQGQGHAPQGAEPKYTPKPYASTPPSPPRGYGAQAVPAATYNPSEHGLPAAEA